MKILVINCGSSSLKYQLINMDDKVVLSSGLVEKIGLNDPLLTHKKFDNKFVIDIAAQIKFGGKIQNHDDAVNLVIKSLLDKDMGVISSMNEINAVGHRLVHGGEKYASSVLINDEVIAELQKCSKLAPLHNPANLIGIYACQKIMPNTPMTAVFDTAFHQTMPEEAYIYSLPYEIYQNYGVRRYGFHGTSHQYVANVAAEFIGQDIKKLKIITCHLGNGASITAIKHGISIDTSMGFTPLAGLTMGTRCGDIDPSILTYLSHEMNLSIDELDNIMNKKSGVLGLSGVSSDFRDIENAASNGDKRAELALKVFNYHVRKYIGAYVAAMNGIDVIIFTAGLGENSIATRKEIIDGLSYLDIKIDNDKNNVRGKLSVISTDESNVKAMLVPTNEELMIAIDTMKLLKA